MFSEGGLKISEFNFEIKDIYKFKEKPNPHNLGFGKFFTDRMFLRKYENGKWDEGMIKKLENFSLSPATSVFHYGQEIFEGLKAFKQKNGDVVIFRIDQNAKRLISSSKRMVIPPISEEYFIESITKLISLEKSWVPDELGTSLYIRPTIIATEPALGVHPSDSFYYYVILSPSGSYFAEGLNPIKILVEDKYVRASIGGTGSAKTGGNYAGSLLASKLAKSQGFSQVLWLDAKERKYVEEVGSMNIAFVLNDTIYTPPLSGSILEGITRKSVIQLSKDLNIPLKEEALSIETIVDEIQSGNLTEIFGMGTAASIAPVGQIKYKNHTHTINNNEIGPITKKIYNELIGIQYGLIEDRHNWMYKIK